jgi:hypothetical protein
METLYKQQKAAKPDQPVQFGLDDRNNETYARLLHRLPLAVNEYGHTQRDQVEADQIRKKLGLKPQKKETSSVKADKQLEGEKLVDLATMSQDQYADWLVDNMLDENDIYQQLTLRPEYRQYTKAQRIEMMQKEPTSQELKDLTANLCNLWAEINALPIDNIKAIGNKGAPGWNNFEINEGTGKGSEGKGYLTFRDVAKDFSPEAFSGFMKRLQQEGFAGQVKTYEVASKFRFQFDNIVFHGKTKNDVDLAMKIAKQMFGDKLSQTQFGKDGKNSEGKSTSHTDLLAERVKKLREEKYKGQI